MQQSSDRTTGGRQTPPYKGYCAKCLRRRPISEMQIEANERSAAYNYYVCRGSYSEGGCYDGPYPDGADGPTDTGTDNVGPHPNLLHTS